MSIFYATANSEGSQRLFEKRNYYNSILSQYQRSYKNITDFNFAEKQWYGRVDRSFVPRIFKNSGKLQLKQFKQSNINGPPLQAVNFVVDAFTDLARQFTKCAMIGKIDTTDPYLSQLMVYSAYKDPNLLYGTEVMNYAISLKSYFSQNRLRYKNFDEFMVHLDGYFEQPSLPRPYTLPAFMKSRFCSIAASGLAIEIADLDPTNDEEKMAAFVSSKNWQFYVNACRSYGFMVDKNVPWRLVADIGSSEMMKYASKYQMHTTNQILSTGYAFAHIQYFDQFKLNLLRLYDALRRPQYTQETLCGDGSIVTEVVTTTEYKIKTFYNLYDDLYFIRKYFKIRFKEEESKFSASDIRLLVDDVEELYNVVGRDRALTLLETVINKPFDYRGSWTYIKEHFVGKDDFSNSG